MRSTIKKFSATALGLAVIALVSLTIHAGSVPAAVDDEAPETTLPVARVSYLSGDAQIRRTGSEDWERVTANLPVVEGDEIATERGTRLEIQFDAYRYLRLEENSYLKITTLRDEGIAVSISEGSVAFRLLEFDKDSAYFEVDAPKTTVAAQKPGAYRVNAGDENYTIVEISASEGGEARVYSVNSGFLLRDGRSARVFTEGQYAGEWDIGDAASVSDSFDTWSLERDEQIIARLKDAHYGKYYDRDIYGAEDLNEYGEWLETRDYGWVWRPYSSSIRSYSNWSPYRYGSWRWVPPFGWTWVNDEPWGWATYHHGRWVFYNGYWIWTPYGAVRTHRSWWRPALVVLASIGNSVCWYPLPYSYNYYNYNYNYHHHGGGGHGGGNGNPTPTPTPNPTPTPRTIDPANIARGTRLRTPTLMRLPEDAVVSVDSSEFGRGRRPFATATPILAREVLSKVPDAEQTPPILPTMRDLNKQVSRQILVTDPKARERESTVRTGADTRTEAQPLDEKLREQRMFGNRTPLKAPEPTGKSDSGTDRPRTGAVVRPGPEKKAEDRTPPIYNGTDRKADERKSEPPVYNPRRDEVKKTEPPVVAPREERRQPSRPTYTPPPKSDPAPRYDPPPRNDPPPRSDPAPKNDPPPKSDPPKSDPPARPPKGKPDN